MKDKAIPTPVVVVLAVVVLAILGFVAYKNFAAPPAQIDPAKEVSATRLEDPDIRPGQTTGK